MPKSTWFLNIQTEINDAIEIDKIDSENSIDLSNISFNRKYELLIPQIANLPSSLLENIAKKWNLQDNNFEK